MKNVKEFKILSTLINLVKRKKKLSIVVAAVCVGLAGFLIFRGTGKASGEYTTDTVKKGTVTTTISASGTVEPVNTVQLSFKNSEIINNIYVKIGDHVTAGQLLAEQDSDSLKAEVSQSEASLQTAEAKLQSLQAGSTEEDLAKAESDVKMSQENYDVAQKTLERDKTLAAGGFLAQADLEKANLDFINAEGKLTQSKESLKTLQTGSSPEDIASAEAQVESCQAQLKVSENDLAGAKMTSPLNGIVSAVNGSVGQRATANNNNTSGGGFITVISEELQVRAQVNEADIGRTQVGQKVEFTVNSYPNKTFSGKVSSISPEAYTVSNVQIYDVIILPDEKYSELKAGMPANVTIIVEQHENVLTIPKGAVSYAVSYLNKVQQQLKASGKSNGTGSSGSQNGGQSNRHSGSQNSGSQNSGGQNSGQNGGSQGSDGGKGQNVNSNEQRAIVLVLDNSGSPVPRRIVLGISDMRYYEVVSGLKEGEKVVLGSAGDTAAQTTTGTQAQGRIPFMGGGREGR